MHNIHLPSIIYLTSKYIHMQFLIYDPSTRISLLLTSFVLCRVFFSFIFFLHYILATRRNALCMTFCWFAFSMGYFGLVYNTPTFDWNIYLVFVLPTFLLIPCVYLEPFFENKFGRKPIFTFSLITAGMCCSICIIK